jgi:predicted amidohydrolase YtcJ
LVASYPELILFGGRIHTQNQDLPVVEALAVQNGRIAALGQEEEVLLLAGPSTRMLDLAGRTAIPGLIDSHIHLMDVGTKLSHLRLDECRTPRDMMLLIRERARETPPGAWIIGEGWNEGNFPGRKLPTRHDIDSATDQHPVVLLRFYHMDLVNTVALRLAGIDRHTPDPVSGVIVRDGAGEPTGLLIAKARSAIQTRLPKLTQTEMCRNLELACEEMHRFGITSIIDPGLWPAQIAAYQAARDSGMLTVRAALMPSWHGFWDDEPRSDLERKARALGVRSGLGDEWLRLAGLKMGIDGGTTAHTALMYEPFLGESDPPSYTRLDLAELEAFFSEANALGWDIGIHCCGDRAQDLALRAMGAASSRQPSLPSARHSIIHGYFPTQEAMAEMKRLNVAVTLQPTFIYYEGDLLLRDVGPGRAARYKPARTYLDQGIRITSSSDVTSTVSSNPFPALYALVTRLDRTGSPVAPTEAISREEALQSYTVSGAWLTREEAVKGWLGLGALADVAVLDRDYFSVPESQIREIQVDLTIQGGKIVWQRGNVPLTTASGRSA